MSRRVLIARQDSLGDVLLTGPAIRAVAASGAEVTLLCGPRGRAAAELLPGVARVLAWRADWIDAEPHRIERRRIERFVDEVAAECIDEALVFTSFHQSPLPLALLLRMAGVGRIGAISDDYPGSLLDVRHRVPPGIHEVQRALSLAESCGYELPLGDDGALRLLPLGEPHPDAAALGPYVAVHPGASVPARAWSEQRHAELAALLVQEGRNVVLTGSPQERALTARIAKLAAADGSRRARGELLDLAGACDLEGLAATLAAAQALVAGNTGPAHLAAAVGTPVVSVYAPTVPSVRWRPWGVPHRLIERDVPCAGCRARQCPVAGHPCVQDIVAAEILHALHELLARCTGARARLRASAPATPKSPAPMPEEAMA